ncbi:MAG TPA: BON domain-containing protein [Fimbriiglobus sp.]|nr:BON domain-containing protein [Fimbriiglobus sp.]
MRALTAPARRHGLSILLGLLVTPAAIAAPPADPALERTARSALAADRELAGLALMVSVVDRIAVVGGPVPDAAAAARVESVVRAVPGMADVRVECWVPSAVGIDPLRKLVADRLRPGERPPLALAPRAAPDPDPPVLALAPRPLEPLRLADTVTVQRIAAPPALAGLLLAPVAGDGVLPMPTPTIPPQAVPAAGTASVPTVLAALRRDPRFSGLTVEWRSGSAVIVGRAPRHADAWAFADVVRKLPGVGRVVVGAVDVP